MRPLFTLLFSLALATLNAQLPPGFVQIMLADSLNPTDMAAAPDGRIFITQKDGRVLIVENGALLPDPFVTLTVDDYNERGLAHLELDPNFALNGFVYLYYTAPGNGRNRLVRVKADGNHALSGSETLLYECDPMPGTIHNGGAIEFGLDGKLYLAVGDGSDAGAAQAPNSDLGKVLRLNPDGSIPTDNPFYNQYAGKYRAIYALGFRNPFSMDIHPTSGRIFVGDVGNVSWEEVNEIFPGANYGWPIVEGKAAGQALPNNYRDPLMAYGHNIGCSIVGAAFYAPQTPNFPPDYVNKFYFADYCGGYIIRMNPNNGVWESEFITGANRPVSLLTTASGDFYYIARAGLGGGSDLDNTATNNGSLWRVIYTGSNAPFVYGNPVDVFLPQGENAVFRVFAVGQSPLQYRWQRNGVDLPGQTESELLVNAVALADSGALFRCIVTNSIGADTSAPARLRVTSNTRPQPVITAPAPDFLYRAGAALPYTGSATDAEDGPVPPASLTWRIDFHHDDHTHPGLPPTAGITGGILPIPAVGETADNVWYRIHLTARDAGGLTKSVSRDVFPQKSPVTVLTDPPGIPVDADGIIGPTPFTFWSVVGVVRHVTVPGTHVIGDSVFLFKNWQDGFTSAVYTFPTPEDSSLVLTAVYEGSPLSQGIGLLGEYSPDFDFDNLFNEDVLLSRIDTTVNFDWGNGSPAPGLISYDDFMVRWTGSVQPLFDELLTFHTITDDGVRLRVNGSLIIDEWYPQPATEHVGSIFLQAGVRYPVVLEFYENGGGAVAILGWSSAKIPFSVVPKQQLFPPPALIPNTLRGFVWLDANADGTADAGEDRLPGAAVLLFRVQDNTLAGAATAGADGLYAINNLPAGNYRCYVLPPLGYGALAPGAGLEPTSYSPAFNLFGGQNPEKNFAFTPLVGQNDVAALPDTRLYPNPGKGLFFLEQTAIFPETFVRVVDWSGRVALEQPIPPNASRLTLDLRGQPAGLYVAHIGTRAWRVLLLPE